MPSDAPDVVQQFRSYRRSLGRTPRLHKAIIESRGLQFAVFRTEDPQNGALPLLCVNGGLLFDHALLWPALAPLAAHRQLILYDQRGRGRSSVPPGAAHSRVEFDASDLATLPSALGIPRLHLLGHSWGGGIAMLSTRHATEHLASLTLINPVGLHGGWLPTLTDAAAQRLSGPARDRLLAADAAIQPSTPTAADPAALSEYAAAIYPAWFAHPELAALLAPPSSDSVTGAAVSARLRREGYDWRGIIPPLHVPGLIIHGTADLFPIGMSHETRHLLGPQATVLPVADAGHNPFWEAPSIVYPAIATFLHAADQLPPP
jgi:pimeloyl-ACP methyl ester carboxylesterase